MIRKRNLSRNANNTLKSELCLIVLHLSSFLLNWLHVKNDAHYFRILQISFYSLKPNRKWGLDLYKIQSSSKSPFSLLSFMSSAVWKKLRHIDKTDRVLRQSGEWGTEWNFMARGEEAAILNDDSNENSNYD